jgi:ATP-dependent RNA helicase DeaD
MQRTLFSELEVSSEIKSAVEGIGLEKCSSLQAECIPLIMEGKDLLAKCISNAGVIDSYAIPAVEMVNTDLKEIQFLVLVSDRNRALQVAEELRVYTAKKEGVTVASIYHGQPDSVLERVAKSKPSILVSTMKPLEGLIDQEKVVFDDLKAIIADELSEIAAGTSEEAVDSLLESTTEDTQFIAYTRADTDPVLRIVEQFTEEYIQVSIEPSMELDPAMEEEVYEVGRMAKMEVLQRLIDFYDLHSSVLYCNTVNTGRELSRVLNLKGYRTAVLGAASTSSERNDAIDYFNAGDIDFLIVTDLGGEGLDLEGVQQVIQYELSHEVDDFGERARVASRNLIFVAPEEIAQLDVIEDALGKSLRRYQIPFIEGLGTEEENRCFDAISTRLVRGDFRRREAMVQRILAVAPSTCDALAAAIDHALEQQSKVRGFEDEARAMRKPPRQTAHGTQARDNFRRPAPPKKPRPGGGGQAMTQISLNVGYRDQIKPNHVVGAILGETGLSADCVGMIEIFDTNVLVEIAKEHSEFVLDRLNQTNINGIKIKAEPAYASTINGGKGGRGRGGSKRPGQGGGGPFRNKSGSQDKRGGNDGNYYD